MIKNLQPKLCEQGKIKIGRLGEERRTKDGKNTYRLPSKLNHFLITSTERDQTENFVPNISLMKEIAETVNESADHLTTIPIYLLFDDIDSNFYTCYNCYQGKNRICTGDGEKAVILGTGEEITCPCHKLTPEYKGPAPCKPYGRLTVVLQNLDIVGGSWVYRTTSWNSIQDILGSLLLIKRIAGRLTGIPLSLKIFPKTAQLPHGPATIYTVSIIYAGSTLALAQEAKQCLAIIQDDGLIPDQTIGAAEEEEILEDFFPPETDTERGKADAEAVIKKIQQKKEPAEKKEPTAADLAKATKRTENAEKKKIKEDSRARTAAAKKKKEDAEITEIAETKQGTTSFPADEPPVEENETLNGEPMDFGWV